MVTYQKNTENNRSVCTSVKGYLTHGHASVPKVNFAYQRSIYRYLKLLEKKKTCSFK